MLSSTSCENPLLQLNPQRYMQEFFVFLRKLTYPSLFTKLYISEKIPSSITFQLKANGGEYSAPYVALGYA